MTLTEGELKADPRFPRLDREIAAKLIRSCRKGLRFDVSAAG